ncbi:uncharacterized protein MELLADRAFT_110633 [Melampsora larici-populina 98AG31]|uniref:Uncharacterized protein n=1 Tax=Melampsora larici-populina (strain 98AG31 / pathotype 3-4-7) TaxID=747676 RepID=F4S0F9_MELLP|nr:uncharacterized protein MELLADRAFT_110633 [Melampsora larici-populina 98AG31]EGG01758.1 hypothetical protein MELLADRAFT_110633 [Melampsora larici-populina 98AG31]
MIPPLLAGVRHGILPELKDLAIHDRLPNPNAIPGGGTTSYRRATEFDIYVKGHIDRGSTYNLAEAITVHVHKHDFLNHHEVETILDATIVLDKESNDVNTCLGEAQHLVYYTRLMLRSQDPEVIQHRELFKRQYTVSRKQYKRLRSKLREHRKDVMVLWGIMAQEIKRTCDIEDAAAAANGAEPDSSSVRKRNPSPVDNKVAPAKKRSVSAKTPSSKNSTRPTTKKKNVHFNNTQLAGSQAGHNGQSATQNGLVEIPFSHTPLVEPKKLALATGTHEEDLIVFTDRDWLEADNIVNGEEIAPTLPNHLTSVFSSTKKKRTGVEVFPDKRQRIDQTRVQGETSDLFLRVTVTLNITVRPNDRHM